jgi:pyruvyltransferase
MKMFGTKIKTRYQKDKLDSKARDLAFFWQPKTKEPNIGDYLALDIVKQMLHLDNRVVLDKINRKNKLLSIGSVLHFAKDKDTVWGAGRNGKVAEAKHQFKTLNVRSVRGPLTREYLLSKGIACPEIYADPAILSPLFYPEQIMCPNGPSQEYAIVPQPNDKLDFYSGYENLLISPRMYSGEFIRAILNSENHSELKFTWGDFGRSIW